MSGVSDIAEDIVDVAEEVAEEVAQLPENKGALAKSHSQSHSSGPSLSLASCAVNLVLPFINGLMLGFGELAAHEIAWRYNWFDRRNKAAFRIFPEQRKSHEQEQERRRISNVL